MVDLVFQPETLEDRLDGLPVEIVLVLGRLVRLRLDQDRTLEADPVLVIDDKAQAIRVPSKANAYRSGGIPVVVRVMAGKTVNLSRYWAIVEAGIGSS